MIKTFRSAETQALFNRQPCKRFANIENVARRRLEALNVATTLDDLAKIPGNEALKGNRQGQHSIGINDQFRVCFQWRDNDAYEVEITTHYK
jgi:proteic killer suppression protein